MADDPNPDEARLAELAAELADELARAVPPWVERLVVTRLTEYRGRVSDEERRAARAAGEAASTDVVPRLRALLASDVDDQRANPLAIVREGVRHPTAVLAAAGVPGIERTEFDERAFPDDVYGLVPATWSDIDESLHEPGLRWSAAKAFVFKARRRAEGRS